MAIKIVSTERPSKQPLLLVLPVAGKTNQSATEKKVAKGKGSAKTSASQKRGKVWQDFNPGVAMALAALDHENSGIISEALSHHSYAPGAGKRIEVTLCSSPSTLRLSGLSSLESAQDDEWRKAGGDAVLSAKRLKLPLARIDLRGVPQGAIAAAVQALTEGAILASYEFHAFKGLGSKAKTSTKEIELELLVSAKSIGAAKLAVSLAELTAAGVNNARSMVNTPPSDMLPKDLVQFAKQIAGRKGSGVKCRIFNRSQLKSIGAGGILAVSRGSDSEPFLIHLEYKPKRRTKNTKRITLIGKGITFDSGGLSIKTGKGMEDMKCDMAGAAAVLSVMETISKMPKASACQHEIHVLVPTSENMINGKSIKPGDVFKALNGKTVEVLNTDAEGRLVLADALSYSAKLKSDLIVDAATLTGACVVALGTEYAGLFSNSEQWTKRIQEAATASGERLWPLPLAEEYRAQMESDVADLRNIGTGGPGAIIAALFLKEFVPAATPWIHLDIAGPAFGMKPTEYVKRGGTGFGVLTLLRLISALA